MRIYDIDTARLTGQNETKIGGNFGLEEQGLPVSTGLKTGANGEPAEAG